jgi:hypothetical protein
VCILCGNLDMHILAPANVQFPVHNECEVFLCADFGCVMQTQWSMRLEGEEVKVVALGTAWVAAITSFNFLRIFTEAGLQVCYIT